MFALQSPIPWHLLLVLVSIVSGQRFVGDPCRVSSTYSAGRCTFAQQCPQAFRSGRPDLCSYSGNNAIICCPYERDNGVAQQPDRYDEDRVEEEDIFNPRPIGPFKREPQGQNGFGISFRRRSQMKCAEYSQLVMKKFSVNPLVLDPDESFDFEVSDCDFSTPLIVDGEKTKPGEFPQMAVLGWGSQYGRDVEFNCGGVLISDEYVLTAAHCTSPENPPTFVRLGDQNLYRDDDSAEPQDYQVAQVIAHPEYVRPMNYNDIALLRLTRRVRFTKFIRPACLWQDPQLNVTHAIATGWGTTDFGSDKSDELLKVQLSMYSNNECQQYYERTRKIPNGIVNTQLCAGNRGGRQDTCQGDSGGPLQVVIPGNNCMFHIIGVTSFGKVCGLSNSPGVYTRISSYLDWIENIVWP